jgi:hypothetical protein
MEYWTIWVSRQEQEPSLLRVEGLEEVNEAE